MNEYIDKQLKPFEAFFQKKDILTIRMLMELAYGQGMIEGMRETESMAIKILKNQQ